MGTTFRYLFYTKDQADANRAFEAASNRVTELDLRLSDYNPESELMRLCDKAGGPPVRVSEDLYEVLDRSLEFSRRSEGAFDVSVGPVVRLWRRARRTRQAPDPERLKAALEKVGYQMIHLDPDRRTVKLDKPGMKLDLGGIAKGYAASEALQTMRKLGVNIALVAAAGDIAVGDPPPGKSAWSIAIAPIDEGSPAPPVLELSNAAISTAGDAEQFVEIDGKRYAHIVDPHTGVGVVARASVTVVARDGATADCLDTTAFVLGPERGIKLIEETEGAAGLFVFKRDGKITQTSTKAFDSIPKSKSMGDVETVPPVRSSPKATSPAKASDGTSG